LPGLLLEGKEAVKRRLLIVLGLVGLLSAVLIGPAGAAEDTTGRSISPVKAADGSVTGYSRLNRSSDGLGFRLVTTRLEARHAYTIWWVVFNHPEHCAGAATSSPVRCGMADMVNPDVDASALFADGGVVGRFGVGWFSGSLRVNDPTGAIMGTGLKNPAGADVHFVVRDHGVASDDPELLYQQTHTFGGCNPDCADVQTSVHQA
jgi:hypothetical protein